VRQLADLDKILGAWCARRFLTEIENAADAAGIGNARLNAQLRQRERWRDVHTPSGTVPRPPALART
jgi:hypothetical protein